MIAVTTLKSIEIRYNHPEVSIKASTEERDYFLKPVISDSEEKITLPEVMRFADFIWDGFMRDHGAPPLTDFTYRDRSNNV